MPLVLEIEYLLGVAFAARGPDSAEPDWPPQPDRVFSALVAAWAARGEAPEERAALEWLERQPPPLIEASDAVARPAPSSFVPPNDKLKIAGNPSWRTRQPRRFPAAVPHDPVVRLVWPHAETPPLATLDAIGRDVAYVGHSASLTRCAFHDDALNPRHPGRAARRRVYNNRLKELEAAFQSSRRPSPGAPVDAPRQALDETANTFSHDWLTFEIVGGDLDLRAAAPACKALIKTVMSGYKATVGVDAVPAWVSGHEADGAPARDAHLAAVPLAFAGFEHADGTLMGLALVPPKGRGDLLSDPGFRKALAAKLQPTAPDSEGGAQRRIKVWDPDFPGLDLKLSLSLETERASLDPSRYARTARRWATVTPMVLDRHLKGGSNEEVQKDRERLVADACERSIGVRPVMVTVGKHSAMRGAPSARPSGHAPRWTGWRVPKHFASRPLVHVVVEFKEVIAGPVLIGAGRFCGLGLCLPLDGSNR
jgi:CRISPR-associated protein Csb2